MMKGKKIGRSAVAGMLEGLGGVGGNSNLATPTIKVLKGSNLYEVFSKTARLLPELGTIEYLMAKKILPFKAPKLVCYDGDLARSWYIDVQVWEPKNGKFKRRRLSFDINEEQTVSGRRKRAGQYIQEIEVMMKDASVMEARPQLVVPNLLEAIDLTIEFKRGSIAPRSLRRYDALRKFVVEHYKSDLPKIDKVSTGDLFGFINGLKSKRGFGAKCFNDYRTILIVTFKQMIARGILKYNVAQGLPTIRKPKADAHHPYSMQQVREIFALAEKRELGQYILFVEFLLYTLARPGKEMRLLKVGDLRDRVIFVSAENGKTGKRTIDISPPLAGLIAEFKLGEYPRDYYVFGNAGIPGKVPRGVNYFYDLNRKLMDDLGWLGKGFTLYSWKHTGACHMYEAGVDLISLQMLCGHSTAVQTQQYLTNLGMLRKAGASLARVPEFGK